MSRPVAHRVIDDPAPDSDIVELNYDERHRRRISMQTTSGREFLLDLPKTVLLADGNGLALSDGSTVVVRAKREHVIDVRGSGAAHLLRIAWHLGNRHVQAQILEDGIRVRYDRVILDMLKGLGGEVTVRDAPFHPEGGAYGHKHE